MPSQRLKQQWPTLVDEPYEAPSSEYKQSAPWDDLKYQVAKAALGMANLRDGGIIVIGVESDENDHLAATGMAESHLDTYRIDDVHEFIDSFSQTRMSLRAETLESGSKKFFVIEVDPFSTVPVIARKSSPPICVKIAWNRGTRKPNASASPARALVTRISQSFTCTLHQ